MKILNIRSEYRDEVLTAMPLHSPNLDLDLPPTEEELFQALSRLKKGKAGGKSGLLPELITSGGTDLWDRVLEVIKKVWEDGKVVRDWQDAVVIPIPKKGDLMQWDNWRGISLLDVIGNILARIVQERLQVITDNVLPELQSGFRKGRWTCGYFICC